MSENTITSAEQVKLGAAEVLLSATVTFLIDEGIPPSLIEGFLKKGKRAKQTARASAKAFRTSLAAYEEVGIVLATWFSDARFLDETGLPVALTLGTGRLSLAELVRASRIKLTPKRVVELLRNSPSVRFESHNVIYAITRTFVLPDFQVPRAALIIERLLDTLHRNEIAKRDESPLLLERSCHVTAVNARSIAPIMRDIKAQGVAFLDSVDGEIEAHRARRSPRTATGELGVLAFAWATRARRPRKRG